MMKTFMLGMAGGIMAIAAVQAEPQATRYESVAEAAHDMGHMDMPMTGAVVSASAAATPDSDSTKAFKAADAKMHKAMMVTYTGDADVDFLRGMIPHHQGAIDMANIVLKYGTDADVRMLAGDIVKAQEKEIRMMQDWLAKHGPKDASASDARAEVPAAKPAVAVTTKPVAIPQPMVSKEIKNVPVPVAAVTAVEVSASVVSGEYSGWARRFPTPRR